MPPRRSRHDKVKDQDEYAQFEDRLGRIIDERLGYVVEKITRHMASIIDGRKRGRRQNRSVSYSTGVAMEFTGHAALSRQRSHIRLEKENRLGKAGITIDDSEYAMEYSDPPSYDESAFEDDGEDDKEYSHPPICDKEVFEENGVGKEYSCPPIYDADPFYKKDEERENNMLRLLLNGDGKERGICEADEIGSTDDGEVLEMEGVLVEEERHVVSHSEKMGIMLPVAGEWLCHGRCDQTRPVPTSFPQAVASTTSSLRPHTSLSRNYPVRRSKWTYNSLFHRHRRRHHHRLPARGRELRPENNRSAAHNAAQRRPHRAAAAPLESRQIRLPCAALNRLSAADASQPRSASPSYRSHAAPTRRSAHSSRLWGSRCALFRTRTTAAAVTYFSPSTICHPFTQQPPIESMPNSRFARARRRGVRRSECTICVQISSVSAAGDLGCVFFPENLRVLRWAKLKFHN